MSIANVLLVDDEVDFVETFSERLTMRNLEISKAFSRDLKGVQWKRGPQGT
jgi:hypothetical protein